MPEDGGQLTAYRLHKVIQKIEDLEGKWEEWSAEEDRKDLERRVDTTERNVNFLYGELKFRMCKSSGKQREQQDEE